MADVNAGRRRTARTPTNEDVVTAAVERQSWRSPRDTAQELGLSKARDLEVLHGEKLQPYHC
jgi:hypothetical protein